MKHVKLTIPMRIFTLLFGVFLSVTAFAQDITVNGHVTDGNGETIIGATVRIAGQQGGTVTDADGNFILKTNEGANLEISYIGYQTQTVAAAANVTVTLQDDAAQSLNEVVVIGYGVVKKSDLTGSVAALRPDSKNKGLVVNPQDMIAGKVAGVNVTSNDGTPGGGAQIRVRGGSSLNASNDPLIVIDGVAMDNNGVKGLANPLSMINPQDIESFNVLKDASAAAIYGSRGSNGVIIITTKKGRAGQAPTISYGGSATVSMKNGVIDVMDGNQYRDFIRDIWGEGSVAYSALGTANTDWQDLIYRTAISQDHNITLSGALKDLPYRVSVGYTGQQGILKTSDFQRVTASLNLSPSFFDNHLTLNLNARGMFAKTNFADGGAVGAAVMMDPTQDPYKYTSPFHLAMFKGSTMDATLKNFGGYFQWPAVSAYKGDEATWPYNYNTLATKNPLSMLNLVSETAYSRSFIGSADIDYKVHGFEDLRLHATLGADISDGTQYRDGSPASPQYMYFGSKGSDNILKRNLQLSMYAQYYHDFNDKYNNHFDIMGGYEWQHFWRSQHNDYVGRYPMTNTITPGEEYPHAPYKFATENYLVSFFGRANWSLMNRYYVTATIRDDGSSRFQDHWALFPSFAFAWKVKDENEFQKIDWLSDLKLRLGYGMTGQQNLQDMDYAWIPSYSINTGVPGSYYPAYGADQAGLYRPNNYTPDLKWETTTTYNVGLDFGIFDQRLSGSIDWYYRNTSDLLNYAPTKTFSAYRNLAWQNIGSLRNTGVELSLEWRAIQNKDWNWVIDYNFTYNENKITDLTGVTADGAPIANTGVKIGVDKFLEYNQVGYPANSFYVYQQVFGQDGKPIEGVVVDRNGDGKITMDDRYYYKNPVAPVIMGLASRLEYKNWDFGFSLRASLGNYAFNNNESGYANIEKNQVWASSNFFTNRPLSVMPLNWQTFDETALLSDYWVTNASFLKIDNVTLGYSFQNLFKTNAWHGLTGRVYGTASNIFTLTNYGGLDPEINNGYDNNMYPRSMSFIFGLNFSF